MTKPKFTVPKEAIKAGVDTFIESGVQPIDKTVEDILMAMLWAWPGAQAAVRDIYQDNRYIPEKIGKMDTLILPLRPADQQGPTITIVDPSEPVVVGSGQPCWGLDEEPEDPPPSTTRQTRGLDNPGG